MTQKPHKELSMSIRELVKQRKRFKLAPGSVTPDELPLREKQAIVDEILREMPIKQVQYYEKADKYMVTQGWPQICAILDFVDNKFPTWTDAEKQEWEQSQETH